MQVTSIDFRFHEAINNSWRPEDNAPAHWTATFNLRGKEQYAASTMEMDATLTEEIMRLLMPIVTREAAKAAMALAEESKALVLELGDKALKQIG